MEEKLKVYCEICHTNEPIEEAIVIQFSDFGTCLPPRFTFTMCRKCSYNIIKAINKTR